MPFNEKLKNSGYEVKLMAGNMAFKCLVTILMLFAACISTPVNSTDINSSRNIEVKLNVPDMGWKILIKEIHQRDETLLVISSLTRHPGPSGQAISTVSDRVRMDLPDIPVKHFILGKTWSWENKEPYTFINSMDDIAGQLEGSRLLYRRP